MNVELKSKIEQITEEICDKYCKYPQEYLARYKNPDDAQAMLDTEKCRECPLQALFWR